MTYLPVMQKKNSIQSFILVIWLLWCNECDECLHCIPAFSKQWWFLRYTNNNTEQNEIDGGSLLVRDGPFFRTDFSIWTTLKFRSVGWSGKKACLNWKVKKICTPKKSISDVKYSEREIKTINSVLRAGWFQWLLIITCKSICLFQK